MTFRSSSVAIADEVRTTKMLGGMTVCSQVGCVSMRTVLPYLYQSPHLATSLSATCDIYQAMDACSRHRRSHVIKLRSTFGGCGPDRGPTFFARAIAEQARLTECGGDHASCGTCMSLSRPAISGACGVQNSQPVFDGPAARHRTNHTRRTERRR